MYIIANRNEYESSLFQVNLDLTSLSQSLQGKHTMIVQLSQGRLFAFAASTPQADRSGRNIPVPKEICRRIEIYAKKDEQQISGQSFRCKEMLLFFSPPRIELISSFLLKTKISIAKNTAFHSHTKCVIFGGNKYDCECC